MGTAGSEDALEISALGSQEAASQTPRGLWTSRLACQQHVGSDAGAGGPGEESKAAEIGSCAEPDSIESSPETQ